MEIDFLISKDLITSKHNIIPIEIKSGDRYTFTSLNKLNNKLYFGKRATNLQKDLFFCCMPNGIYYKITSDANDE